MTENVVLAERRLSLARLFLPRVTAAERARVLAVLADLGLAQYADTSPAALSYGQRKLIELAQVLWLDPALVLLDEPAAGISPALSQRLAGIIRQLRAEGVGVLLVEHDVAFLASLSDRVYVMANGKIIASGTVAEVSADQAVVDAYLGDQVALAGGSGNGARAHGVNLMIEINGLVAGYGGLDILRGVDLSVGRGGITCIVGPNGAGKSTVLKAVSGVLRPKAGSVTIDGTDLTGRDPEAILRAGVAQVPQRGGLFTKLTVRQNVLMGAYVIRNRRKHIETRYDALAETFPILATRPGVLAGTLSGGQRRMVEFARALMLEPAVVLLDEPTLGLDPASLAIIGDSVRAMIAAGTTILMVEQNVRFGLSLATHATVLTAGTVALSGTAAEVAAHPDLMDLFFGDARATGRQGSGTQEAGTR